jgi:hypothetical protein
MADVLPGGLLFNDQEGLVCDSSTTKDVAQEEEIEKKAARLAMLKDENERLQAHVDRLGSMIEQRQGVIAQLNG